MEKTCSCNLIVRTIILFVLLISGACGESPDRFMQISRLNELETVAENALEGQHESVLQIADSAFEIIKIYQLDDSLRMDWISLKSCALIKLGMKDSAFNIILTARDHFITTGNSSHQVYVNLLLIEQFIDEGKYIVAEKYLTESLELLKHLNDEFQMARALNLLGSLQSYTGKYDEAISNLIEATKYFEKLKMTEKLNAVYINIGTNYQATGDYDKALAYFKKSLESSLMSKDTSNQVSALNNIGIHYLMAMSDSAVYYFDEALKLREHSVVSQEILSVQFNLANFYFNQKAYGKSYQTYLKVLETCRNQNIYSGLARSYNAIANIFEARNVNDSAMFYYQKAYHIADSIGEKPIALVFLGNIQYMYEKLDNCNMAIDLVRKIQSSRDSLLSLEKQVAVHDLEMLYNREKAERENEQLNTSIILMKGRMKNNSIILLIVMISALALGGMLYRIYRLYRQRDAAYNTLFEQMKAESKEISLPVKINDSLKFPPDHPEGPENNLYQQLLAFIETEKPYLDSDLRLSSVARKLSVSKTNLSQVIHQHTGLHFNTFINNFRVAEALRLLSLPEYKSYKIESVAMNSGFGSRTSFYDAFSQVTGTRPSDYRPEDEQQQQ